MTTDAIYRESNRRIRTLKNGHCYVERTLYANTPKERDWRERTLAIIGELEEEGDGLCATAPQLARYMGVHVGQVVWRLARLRKEGLL